MPYFHMEGSHLSKKRGWRLLIRTKQFSLVLHATWELHSLLFHSFLGHSANSTSGKLFIARVLNMSLFLGSQNSVYIRTFCCCKACFHKSPERGSMGSLYKYEPTPPCWNTKSLLDKVWLWKWVQYSSKRTVRIKLWKRLQKMPCLPV